MADQRSFDVPSSAPTMHYAVDSGRSTYLASHLRPSYDIPRTIRPAAPSLSESSVTSMENGNALTSPSGSEHRISAVDKPLIEFDAIRMDADVICDRHAVDISIDARMDNRNFFMEDQVWTCYRRNYFAVTCSYSLDPVCADKDLFLQSHVHSRASQAPVRRIQALAMTISATIDKGSGKRVELIQHTPKRDKAPQIEIGMQKLLPKSRERPRVSHHSGGGAATPILPLQHADDDLALERASSSALEYAFERVQYKTATQNNGRRRSTQQYYYVVVELWADVRQSPDRKADWIKVGDRTSAPMVVRGRSPSHYLPKEPRRDRSSGSGNPGSSAFPGAPQHRSPAWPSSSGHAGSSSASSAFPPINGSSHSGYGPYRSHKYLPAHHSRSSPVVPYITSQSHIKGEMISPQEAVALHGYDGYQYYPGACVPQSPAFAMDTLQNRYAMGCLPSGPNYVPVAPIKEEHDTDMYGQRWQTCRPFQGFGESANHYQGMTSAAANMDLKTSF